MFKNNRILIRLFLITNLWFLCMLLLYLALFRTTRCGRRRCFKVRQVVPLHFRLVKVKLRFGSPESDPFARFEKDFKPVPFSGCCVLAYAFCVVVQANSCVPLACWSSHTRPTCFTELHFCPTALPPCWADSSCKWLLWDRSDKPQKLDQIE